VYALLDLSAVIRREHLEAALAVWKYVEASARWIFGESLGDPTADTLLKALRDAPDGLSRTAIRDLFDRNKPRAEIDRALDLLSSLGLIRKTIEPSSEAGGRSTEIWRAV
ncbi:MAG: hypothetical protein FJY85_03420, partial [Deltaproteobacteria bacterium]|nr:hypothetical protein [Deltaproteobacteria bacterium]